MLQASNPAIKERGLVQPTATRDSPSPVQSAKRTSRSDDRFLDHYFKRLDPEVADSFSEEQREAIKVMFGARGIARHTVEVRRSIPWGSARFYLVFLLGPERRSFSRVYSQGMISKHFNFVFYAGLAALLMAPVLALLYSSAQ